MSEKTGVLFVGIMGHIAATVIAGTLLLKNKLCPATGIITELDPFSFLNLTDFKNIIFGGWDIRNESISANVLSIISETNFLNKNPDLKFADDLGVISSNIFRGATLNCGKAIEALVSNSDSLQLDSIEKTILKLKSHINNFKIKNNLDSIVVVNLSSTEPPFPGNYKQFNLNMLAGVITDNNINAIRSSTLYAYAAIDSGCAYINFTPSQGALIPGLIEFAEKRGVPLMGNDGKTGETLVKSSLAPMFACRNLRVLSWEGYNMLGNMDGKILSNSENKSSKIESKDLLLSKILGYKPHSKVAIDYVPSLGDQKTAWDFIHFEGFLNTKMSLQFTWQGSDSNLAAPLILDLIRLSAYSLKEGEKGLMKHLSCFFKSPAGVEEYDLHSQYQSLLNYIENKRNMMH